MKPILFNTEMVRAILDGRKTMTRRIVKHNPCECESKKLNGVCKLCDDKGGFFWPDEYVKQRCPYRPGDILYVRETFCPLNADHVTDGVKYAYKANATPESERIRQQYGYKWHSSIHMPREAARIFLQVKDVRVERLQDMQPYDIAFEGFRRQRNFIALWDSTIKPADRAIYGWEANPWVWVIEFERCEKPMEGAV